MILGLHRGILPVFFDLLFYEEDFASICADLRGHAQLERMAGARSKPEPINTGEVA